MPNLADRLHCTGCSACYNSCGKKAIQMKKDAEGFLFPDINLDLCVKCGMCEKVCPVLNSITEPLKAVPDVYAMWSIPDREKSSSGGAFSALARYVLDQKGVVFGASFTQNLEVKHVVVDSVDDLDALRGSKYMQSELGESYRLVRQYLKNNRMVLFSGTPCQIAGLKAYLGKEFDLLLTVDLACHGVPSNQMFQSYLKKLECKLELGKKSACIQSFEFRRRNGWGFAPSIIASNGEKINLFGVDALYMEAFNASALFRNSCYICKYAKFPRVGDCSIADFWGIGRYGIPFKHDVMKGVSLLMANSVKGQQVISNLKNVFLEKRTLEEALIENHNLKSPSVRNLNRDAIVESFLDDSQTLESINQKYNLVDRSAKAILKNYASKLGLFSVAKKIYNWYKAR